MSKKPTDAEKNAIEEWNARVSESAEYKKKPFPWSAAAIAISVPLAVGAAVVPFIVIPWLPKSKYGGLPFMATSPRRVYMMLEWISVTRAQSASTYIGAGVKGVATGTKRRVAGLRLSDLGSGDGEVVVQAARAGMVATGYELNPSLVAISRLRWLLARPSAEKGGSARFVIGNLLEAAIGDEDVIMVFGVPPLMPMVAKKLEREAKAGALVFCHRFPLPGWTPVQQGDGCLLYRVPLDPSSSEEADAGKQEGQAEGRR